MRKIRILCSLLGHRRDKSRIRPIDDAWRSNCLRCGVALERSVSGKKWLPIAEGQLHLAVHPEPQATVNPFVRPQPTEAVNDQERPPEQHLRFARNLVNAIVPQLGRGPERRDHFIVRAEEARLLAETAEEPQVKVIHLEMAARYYSLANYHLERPAQRSAAG